LIVVAVSAFAADQLWEPLARLPAGGNAGLACGVVDSRIIVAGGTDLGTGVKHALDYVLAFDSAANQWRQIGRLPRPYYYGAFGATDRSLFVIGGDDGHRTRSDVWAVSGTGTSRRMAELSQPVGYVGCTTWQNACYILGGTRDVRDLSRMTADFLRLDLGSGAVSFLPEYPGGPVFQSALAAVGSRIYAFPGGSYNRVQKRAEAGQGAWAYDLAATRWRPISSYPFPVRAATAAPLDETHVFVGGGAVMPVTLGGPTATARAFVYDVPGDNYRPLPPLPFAAGLIGLQRWGEYLFIIGGEDLPRHRNSGVFRARIRDLLLAAGE